MFTGLTTLSKPVRFVFPRLLARWPHQWIPTLFVCVECLEDFPAGPASGPLSL